MQRRARPSIAGPDGPTWVSVQFTSDRSRPAGVRGRVFRASIAVRGGRTAAAHSVSRETSGRLRPLATRTGQY
jgi:hypothetical protein